VQISAAKLSPAFLLLVSVALPDDGARLGETEGRSRLRYRQARDDLTGPADKPLRPAPSDARASEGEDFFALPRASAS